MRGRLEVTLAGMETILILAAVAACAVACLVAVAAMLRGRRAPLHMDSEHDPEDEALLLAEVGPVRSPIDRSAPVIDLVPTDRTEPDARLPKPGEGGR